jgi:DNA polymerase-3 subunit alpha
MNTAPMYLVFDTETTGLAKNYKAPLHDFDNWPRMVQLAWQLHAADGSLLEHHNLLIKPEGFTIPFNATKIHGISTAMAQEKGIELGHALAQFRQAIETCSYAVGHNIGFDLSVIGCEYLRQGGDNPLEQLKELDTMKQSVAYCALPGGVGGQFKYPTLGELHHKLFGQPIGDAHNAAADVEATGRCFFQLGMQGVIPPEKPLRPDLMEHLSGKANDILQDVGYADLTGDKALDGEAGAPVGPLGAPFCHLHVHTQYSVLQSTIGIAELIEKAQKDNQPAVAITDMSSLYAAYTFTQKAHEKKMKGVVGCEFNVCKDMHDKTTKDNGYEVVLLAKDRDGFNNLSKLSSLAQIEGSYYVPRLDHQAIAKHRDGLIALSGGLYGEIAQLALNHGVEKAEDAARKWQNMFGEDYYLELNRHGLEEEDYLNRVLLDISQKTGIKTVAANNVYYLEKHDAKAQDILLCVKEGAQLNTPKRYTYKRGRDYRFGLPNEEFYLKSQEEMKSLFADLPQCIENLGEILDKISPYTLERSVLLPKFDIPDEFVDQADLEDGGNRGENKYLRHLTYQGALARYGELTDAVRERLDFELNTIEMTGYPGYFLIVQDFCHQARKMGVWVGPGRGSAAGSAVAYCIGITNVDPIRYNLLFERFLNPDRVSLPDIDIDFDDEGRAKVLDYVVGKYGQGQVAQIITYGTMAAKSAVRDTARVMGLSPAQVNALANALPETSLKTLFGPRDKLREALNADEMKKADEILKLTQDPNNEWGQVIQQARVLEGSVRNLGVHACGVIITPSALQEHVPLTKAKTSDLLVTQFDNHVVENAGLLKMDFLGLKTLTIIKDAMAIVKQRHGLDLQPDDIDFSDAKTYTLFQKGETSGTFQFESVGMQKYLKELKPDRFEDLIAMNALYRPGPMDYIPAYVARKHGKEAISYDDPKMEEHLAETYGITVYQEQVMLLSQKLAGFTKGDADALRKAMGKKKKDILDKLKSKFVAGCQANDIDEAVANKIWKDWEAFASYAFNKSHATCYAVVAFHTAYLKANYPPEYMAAVLTHNMSDIKKLTFFMDECKRMGLSVLGPDLNESMKTFTVNKAGQIRFGLGGIKGLGESAIDAIIGERTDNGPFRDIWHFASRVNLRAVNKKCIESLAYAGAFDFDAQFTRASYFELGPTDKIGLVEKAVKYGNQRKSGGGGMLASLFGEMDTSTIPIPSAECVAEWPLITKLAHEKETIGCFVSGHPLDDYKYEIEYFTNSNSVEAIKMKQGECWIAGVVTQATHALTAKGNKYGRFTIEDYEGACTVAVFGEPYLKYGHLLKEGEKLMIKLVAEPDFRNKELTDHKLREALLLEEARNRIPKEISLTLPLPHVDSPLVHALNQAISAEGGNSTLLLHVELPQEKLNLTLAKKKKITVNNDLLGRLTQLEITFHITKNN